jgi:hypothetical protein
MLVAKVAITTSASVERASLTEVAVHSESPGLLAGASGPMSVLGTFNLYVWNQYFYQYRTKELEEFNYEHSIVSR